MILKPYMFSVSNTGGMLSPIANAIVRTVSNGLRTPRRIFPRLESRRRAQAQGPNLMIIPRPE